MRWYAFPPNLESSSPMAVGPHPPTDFPTAVAADAARPHQVGFIPARIGAATITLWGLVVDVVSGRLFYTASALGTALFDHSMPFDAMQKAPVSMEMAMMFVWLRALAFMAIGGVAAHLLGRVDRHPSLGFCFVLLATVFGFGFTVVNMIFAAPILHGLMWPIALVGNLLAATAMAGYFRRCHPHLTMHP